jgi:hypothetical protein
VSKKTLAFLRGIATLNDDQRAPSGWLRMEELPVRRTLARKLINEGFIDSVIVASPGSKRGVRLVSRESLDRYLRSLLAEQKTGTAAAIDSKPARGKRASKLEVVA